MRSLSDHLRRAGDHGALPFHPDCPLCRAERLGGPLPADALVPGRTRAGILAGVIAASAAAGPAAALPGVAQASADPPPGAILGEGQSGGGAEDLPEDVRLTPEEEAQIDPGSGGQSVPEIPDDPVAEEVPSESVPEVPESEALPEPDAAPSPPEEAAPAPGPQAEGGPTDVQPPGEPAAPPPPDPVPPAPRDPARVEPPDEEPEPRSQGRRAEDRAPDREPPAPPPESLGQAGAETPTPAVASPTQGSDPDAAGPEARGSTYVVKPGDSLWSIAKSLLGPDATPAEIAREVDRLWRVNAGRIGTGNPNLILPGQRLVVA